MRKFLFDVDGTLTEPKEIISDSFKKDFLEWSKHKDINICSGASYTKLSSQVSSAVLKKMSLVFACLGNTVYTSNGECIFTCDSNFPSSLESNLDSFLAKSVFNIKTGNHLEKRVGMWNFSIVGANATKAQREEYSNHDLNLYERLSLIRIIKSNYTEVTASLGGKVSVDIMIKGQDKRRSVYELIRTGAEEIIFFGDRCSEEGNDYPVVKALKDSSIKHTYYNVSGPEETIQLLKFHYK